MTSTEKEESLKRLMDYVDDLIRSYKVKEIGNHLYEFPEDRFDAISKLEILYDMRDEIIKEINGQVE